MLRNKKPNPLNFLNLRKLEVPPPYFEYVSISLRYNLEDALSLWITENLKGRYYIGKSVDLIDNSIETVLKIGFENPKELSFFTLACPLLKYK